MSLLAQINASKYLYLLDIRELNENVLRITIGEATVGQRDKGVGVAGVTISNLTAIEHRPENLTVALTWDDYIGYSVLNESFALPDAEESKFEEVTGSRFERYVSEATWSDEVFGKRRTWRICCLNHIIDVTSVVEPKMELLVNYNGYLGSN